MPTSHNRQHNHGGQLRAAAQHYAIPLHQWIDLSTGISPFVYPLPNVPQHCWQRLPESDDNLIPTATNYYGSHSLLAVAGSQEAIQRLPLLFPKKQRVGILKPAYHSHLQAWQQAGHNVIPLSSNTIDAALATLDILIIVNPCNPSTECFSTATLLHWHQQLQQHQGTLIVDEAFIDTTPEHSLITTTPQKGLIVLRSIGKFFGLAGIRLGFVWAEQALLTRLAAQQDDWSVSHPARWAGTQALQDTHWQHTQRNTLKTNQLRLTTLLEKASSTPVYSHALFCYLPHPKARAIHQQFAQQGILTRLFNNPSALRLGLPATEEQWQRLTTALSLANFS